MSLILYMDENVTRQITDGLRLRGVDVLTVQEDNLSGYPDTILLDRATKLQRVMFSQDRDLPNEAERRQAAGIDFSSVIYAHQLFVLNWNLCTRPGAHCQGWQPGRVCQLYSVSASLTGQIAIVLRKHGGAITLGLGCSGGDHRLEKCDRNREVWSEGRSSLPWNNIGAIASSTVQDRISRAVRSCSHIAKSGNVIAGLTLLQILVTLRYLA